MKRIILASMAAICVSCQGCKKENSVHVHCDNLINDVLPAGDQAQLYVATAFTPNNDGINDFFRPVAMNVSSISVKVYDKNANLVFQTTQAGAGWNPTLTANETFYFRVEAVTLTNSRIGQCGELGALSCFPQNPGNNYTFEDQLTPFGFTGVTSETLAPCN